MSGTSADGVDASIIQSDGDTGYKVMLDKYFKYDQNIYENIHNFKEKINDSKDLRNLSKNITIPIVLWDERLSSEGSFKITHDLDTNVTDRVKKLDKNAAAFILQGAIDFLSN